MGESQDLYIGAIVNVPSGLIKQGGEQLFFAAIVTVIIDAMQKVVKLTVFMPDGELHPSQPFVYDPLGRAPQSWHWPKPVSPVLRAGAGK